MSTTANTATKLAQQLHREAKRPGMCKSSVLGERCRLAAIIMGIVGHEAELELLVVELLNPQPSPEWQDEEDADEDIY